LDANILHVPLAVPSYSPSKLPLSKNIENKNPVERPVLIPTRPRHLTATTHTPFEQTDPKFAFG